MIIESKNQGALAALLKPGMRAIAINVDPASISGGLIVPGDIVDVIITFTQGVGAEQHVISRTALCEVRVLALDQKVTYDPAENSSLAANLTKKDPTAVPRTVTLEILPEEVERLTTAVKQGTPSLSLHSVTAGTSKCRVNFSELTESSEAAEKKKREAVQEAPPPPQAEPKTETVKIIRGNGPDASAGAAPMPMGGEKAK
jgi:pilus assembly protein CpaB